MKNALLRFLLAVSVLFGLVPGVRALHPVPAHAAVAAFPGAEGFGAGAVGGRGGRVIQVTNLNDSGSGSLRACVSASGPRTCVFRVAGRIVLATPLLIDNPYLTIAGQTAPGNGITLSAGPNLNRGIVVIRTHDVILRYLGLRPGLNANQTLVENEYNLDALTIGDLNVEPYNVVIDHVSMAWATDEILNTARRHHGLTIQWSIMSEVNDCDGDPTNNRCGGKGPLFHTGTDSQRGGGDISFHHNLLSSNQGRNPMIKNAGGVNDVVNNVIFPTTRPDGTAITTILDSTHGDILLNFVGNYLLGDPAHLGDSRYVNYLGMRMAYPLVAGRLGGYQVYVRGNRGPMRPADICPGLSPKACELLIINPVHVAEPDWNQRGDANLHLDAQGNLIPHAVPPVTTHDAETAFSLVLAQAGKSARLNADGSWTAYRDSIDAKIIADVHAGRAIQISGQPWPPSPAYWPAGTTTPSYPDADADGMSDVWETLYFGSTARGSAASSAADFDADGYTDLEEFLNGTNPRSAGQVSGSTATPGTTPVASPTATRTVQPTNTASVLPSATSTQQATSTHTSVPEQPATATHTAPTSTPPPPPPTETPPAASPGLIWADGFESGNLSAWSSSHADGDDLSVTSAAALDGAWGLQVVIDDAATVSVNDERPTAESHYRVRFAFDPNSIDMGRGNSHAIFHAYAGDQRLVVRLELRRTQEGYQLRPALQTDNGRWTNGNWFDLADAPHQIELDWQAGAPGANNGSLSVWLDGALVTSLNGVDNDSQRIESASLGAIGIEESNTHGTYYFDNFVSER